MAPAWDARQGERIRTPASAADGLDPPPLDGLGLPSTFDRGVERDAAAGRLLRARDDWGPERRGFSLHDPSRRQIPPALRALIDMLKA